MGAFLLSSGVPKYNMPPSHKLTTYTTDTWQRRQLAWGAAWRITAWGVALGALLGSIVGGAVFIGNGGLIPLGLLSGVIAGGALGLLEGIIIGSMLAMHVMRSRVVAPAGYQALAGQLSLTGVAIVYIVLSITILAVAGRPLDWAGASCLPLLVNVGAAWIASGRVALWMERTTEAHENAAGISSL